MTQKKFEPAQYIVVPNDKFNKKFFEFNAKDWTRRITTQKQEGYGIKEGKKDNADVMSRYNLKISVDESLNLTSAEREYLNKPLNLFDRLVLAAVTSEYLAGNKEITVDVLYRTMNGKPSGKIQTATEKQKSRILMSVKKLACVQISANLTDACSKFGYNKGKPLILKYTPLLKCRIVDGTFCNQPAQLIIMDTESPLYKIAMAKSQLVTFVRSVLDTGRGNSENISMAKFYTVIRALDNTDKPNDTILFDTIFEKCGLTESSRPMLARIRKAVIGVMENLKGVGRIKSYEVIQEGTGDKFTKITLKHLSTSQKKSNPKSSK